MMAPKTLSRFLQQQAENWNGSQAPPVAIAMGGAFFLKRRGIRGLQESASPGEFEFVLPEKKPRHLLADAVVSWLLTGQIDRDGGVANVGRDPVVSGTHR